MAPRRAWAAGREGLALSAYLLLAALFYAPLLLGLRTFPDGDFTHHFLPFSQYLQQAWLALRLPVWNPYTYAGHPFLADVQAAVFYPLGNGLLLLTLPFTAPGARLYFLQVEAALHLALAGFFTYLLVRDLVQQRPAAFVAGLVFAFSGYLTGYPPLQLAILRTAIWLPLILWLLGRAFARPGQWRWWVGGALVYASALLAGHPQTFLHLSYVVAAWIGLLAAGRPLGRRVQRPAVAGVLAFYLLALALSAAQLWPSLEFTRLSVRARVDYGFVSGGLPLQDTWQMVLPGVLTQFSPLYVGVVGLGLAAWAMGQLALGDWDAGRAPRHFAVFFALVALVALLLAYGDNGFLYPWFYRFAPGWNLFRGQERAAYLVAFGLSVLAGYGAAGLPRLAVSRRRVLATVFGLALLAGIGVLTWGWQMAGRTAGLGLFILAAFGLLLWQRQWQAWRMGALTLLVVIDLFAANAGTNLADFGPARKTILAPEMEALQRAVQEREAANLGQPQRAYNEYRIYVDYGMRLQVEDVWGSSPLRLARYAALFEEFPLDRLWRLTGVEHVLTWRRDLFMSSRLLAEFPQAVDTTFLHRLEAFHPRAWVAGQVHTAEDPEALALLADHGFDLDAVAVVAPPEAGRLGLPAAGSRQLAPEGHNQVRLARMGPERLQVEVESQAGGLLVVGENWMPGWQILDYTCGPDAAPCDLGAVLATWPSPPAGNLAGPVPVLRADLTLLAVPVPAGTSRLVLAYRPASVRYGLWISGGSLFLLAGLGAWRRLRGG